MRSFKKNRCFKAKGISGTNLAISRQNFRQSLISRAHARRGRALRDKEQRQKIGDLLVCER
jgi:hypothetical protein